MPIQVPKERAYYYELSAATDRLFYWIPWEELKIIVGKGGVKEDILEDYPDGLDIEVSQDQFDDFREIYGLYLDIDPVAIWNAFRAILLQGKKPCSRTGFLRKEYLDDLAEHMSIIEDKETSLYFEYEKGQRAIDNKREFKKLQSARKKLLAHLKKFKIKGFKKRVPLEDQFFAKVDMREGEEPIKTFSRIHRSTIKRK